MSSRPSSSRVALNFLIATRAPRRTLRRQAVEGFYERIYWFGEEIFRGLGAGKPGSINPLVRDAFEIQLFCQPARSVFERF